MKTKSLYNLILAFVLLAMFSISKGEQGTTRISGIGVGLQKNDNEVILKKVLPGEPAEKAGLHAGDRIIAIDDKAVREMDLKEVQSLIKGPAGSEVRLLVEDENSKVRNITIVREVISISAESADDFTGLYRFKDAPDRYAEIRKSDEGRYEISSAQEKWRGFGIIYQNPSSKSFHYKGVFYESQPEVKETSPNAAGFFRINYLTDGALEMKYQWNLSGDTAGDNSVTRLLLKYVDAKSSYPDANKAHD
jgi:hypothetical protein